MARKHDWNELQNYLVVVLRVVRDHPFVVGDNLEIPPPSQEAGEIAGDIFCHENVVLDVLVHYEIRAVGNRQQARTSRYSYHARYGNGGDILRYDNADQHRGHPTRHHRHDFRSGRDQVTHVGADWPHLNEVLDELMEIVWLGQ
ncbi:MAG TPA: DUF6516 family protein [Dehalococcoidia bacterium]|nr:DUF6516 family protein [Dehalococcoidia bacterium]